MAIDPELAPFIAGLEKAWPEPPLTLTVAEWRARIETLSTAARQPYPAGLSVSDHEISADRPLRVRVYRPKSDRALPALVYMHGGGWVVGSINSHDGITAALANDTPCVVISVDYARAPEHPFPAAVEDCQAAVAWVFDNAETLGIDAEAIAVGGDSAGGNLAASMTFAFRGTSRRIRGQLLLYPCVDIDFSTGSYRSEANAPYLKAAEMVWFWAQYCPDGESRSNPLAVPMRQADLSNLPPAFVVVAEHDPLRDEGRAYAEKLRAAGNDVTFRPGHGLIHGFLRARGFARSARDEHAAMTAWLTNMPALRKEAAS
jgi:acetyl esterase